MNIRITRTNTKGLKIVYDSKQSATTQLSIGWNSGPFGGVAMSLQQAEELQSLLSEVLRLASPAIDPTMEKAAAAVEAQLLPWRDREPAPVQPEPKGAKPVVDYSRVPEIATEAQIRSAAQYLVKKQNCDGDLIPAIEYAIARWGRPTPQPPVDGEVAELVEWLRETGQLLSRRPDIQCRVDLRLFARAAELLERPTPQPVAEEPMIPSRYRGYQIAVYRDGFHAGYKEALARAANALPTPEAHQ